MAISLRGTAQLLSHFETCIEACKLMSWVSCTAGDVLMGPKILNQVSDAYRKLRFTVRFLLGNVHDFDPATNAVPYDALPATDRFLLATFGSLLTTLASSYETYQFYRVYQARLPAVHVSSATLEDPRFLQVNLSCLAMGPC